MDKIQELLTRGVDTIYPSREELEKVLLSGKKLKLYQGFDPTGDKLHIGHMIGLRKLREWQALGHHVIFLIGDFTARVGDPTGKLNARKMLAHEEVLKNAESYKHQAGKILDFNGSNPVEVRFNSEWLEKIPALEFIQIAGLLSVQQVVERDMFQERQKRGQDIYMSEFLYPIMQAYDSVYMNVDLEIGGTDQMFNMLMGRKLMRHMLKKNKFVMTTPLLSDSNGRKIGKTEGNVIGLTDKPKDLFGKIMSLSDDVIVKGLEYLTDVPIEEIQEIEHKIKQGDNPMHYKKRLAFEIVKQLNSEKDAKHAEHVFERVVQHKKTPVEHLVAQSMNSGTTISDAVMRLGFASSKSESKRLIQQGGTAVQDKVITDSTFKLPAGESTIRVGNRKFGKVKIEG